MRKYVLVVFCALLTVSCFSTITEETGSFQNFLFANESACEYDRWVSHVSEGIAIRDYNLYAPWDRQTNGFGAFHQATANELTQWNLAVSQLMSGSYDAAQETFTANSFPYKVVKFNDTDTGRTYYLLRENLNMSYTDDQGTTDSSDDEFGSFDYGWGLYVYNPLATSPVIVNVVHPNDDFIAPYIATKAFMEWNAMFLQIAGAGREIAWTGNYTNSNSLSDPSRIDATAFSYAYKIFCGKIRQQFGKRELSVQIHSYDWNRHAGYASNQVSAGANSSSLDLPVRDLSNLHEDMIHHGQPVMFTANTIGSNRAVKFNDYYAFFNRSYPIIYSNADTSFACNTNVDLWGFSMNKQAVYTLNGWNDNDVYDPFLHIEMDELPNCYDQTNYNLKWFYGYDTLTGKYDQNTLFNHTWSYYQPLIHNITATLPSLFAMNDNQPPSAPTNLQVYGEAYDSVNLQWNRSYAYDFRTYEIMYATEPITGRNYSLYTRDNDALLASQANNQITIPGLEYGIQYYFKIRAKDYNGNYSSESNMIYLSTGPAVYSQNPGILHFGSVIANTVTAESTVTISNTGGTTMNIISVEKKGIDQDRFILTDANRYPYTLEAGGMMTFTVAFNPLDVADYSAEINITDDLSENVHILLLSGTGIDSTLPVELSSFTAVSETSQLLVTLQWTTESETNNLGFNILRSTDSNLNNAISLNHEIITGTNTSTQHSYQFADTDVEAPNTYYYWLENIDFSGLSGINGPVTVIVLEQEDPDNPPVIPVMTKLNGAYPNPFNPQTIIGYDVKTESHVSIEIFNVKGQHIKTLVNRQQSPNHYAVAWYGTDDNGKAVSSGVYFYRMTAGKYCSTRKVALMK